MAETTTSTKEARAALERAAEPKEKRDVRAVFERLEPELIRSLQDPAAVQILMRHYLTAVRLNPMLEGCTDVSLAAALHLSAQMRLEPGPLGHVYLVPFGRECQWVLGYTGIIELARRSDAVADLTSEIVWDCDVYERPWRNQSGVHYEHRPGDPKERRERVGVLVTWRELSGGKWFPRAHDVGVERIERARKASRAKSGPWFTDEDAMWRKTGVRAVRPFLPLSPAAGRALALDGAVVAGVDDDAEPIIAAGETEGYMK